MARDEFLETARNLARYHREHEKFYARRPLEEAAALQRTSAALRALAERWSGAKPTAPGVAGPFSGAEDLNDDRAIELAGILFMEGGEVPAEITRIMRELNTAAEDNERGGEWLSAAMETSWSTAEALLQHPELSDVLSERHRIIANDWQAAALTKLVARNLDRAHSILERIDFSARSLREDLTGLRNSIPLLHAACDLIDHATDLAANSATLVHDNERRWRLFRRRIDELVVDAS